MKAKASKATNRVFNYPLKDKEQLSTLTSTQLSAIKNKPLVIAFCLKDTLFVLTVRLKKESSSQQVLQYMIEEC